MQRYGKKNNGTFGLIDDLTYLYNGNQIQSISDKAGSLLYDGSFDFKDGANEGTEYFYNANGALTKDLNKGISKIEYDVLDNLSSITFNNGFKTKYVYDAGGNKLRTIHEALTTNTTDYIGDFIFEDGKLSKYQFEGGYCSFDSNLNPTYHYYEKDHLGSIRMVVNENGTIEQVNHYYPFGGVYGDLGYNSELQRNKYIGKEFDHTSGLDWYDHGARMYDAAKGSWDRMDYFCEKYYPSSPYISCFNNPTRYIDESGDSAIVLLAPYGARNFGHLAIAIQNENGVWCLYSKNGTYEHFGIWGQEGSSDTEKHNDRGEKTATEINSLFNNPSINPKVYKKGEREDVPNNAPEYTEGYLLFTTPAQDKKMVEGVMEVIDKDYNLANSNCAQAVQNALKKAGLNPGRGLRPKKGVYPSIIKNNPKGKVVLFYNTNTKKHYKYGK
ncbi:RHS repeat domain-containing protein [Prevotella sp. Sow4_E9_plate]|uniref:RHS repeat domain-containing protein n=1 Tax=Prevotella sp. Sow4_E9_plate TaxID=3438802 RepID=UPI003F949F55